MLKKYAVFFLLAVQTTCSEIVIRPALDQDLEEILELDRAISWEYFKPLFLKYTDLPLAEQADTILELDILDDRTMFMHGINHQDNNQLFVALDNTTIVGFIAFSKQQTTLNIDLILIHKDYRHKKIGRQLIETALNAFSDILYCTLLVLDKNVAACKFYEAYGFQQEELPDKIKQGLPANYWYIYLFYKLTLTQT